MRTIVLLGLLIGLVFAIGNPHVRMAPITVALLPHFFPGDVQRPLRALAPSPAVSTVAVEGAPGRMVVDIYRPPGEGRRPAIILLLGVNPLPRGHEQVTTLADGIARTGILTAVAESDALLAGEVRVEEIDNLVALFEQLERDPGVDPRRIGFSGFCIGGVLELLAAADDRIANRVAYVNAFSVYDDPISVLRAVLTQEMPTSVGQEPWLPDRLTRTVFTRHVIGLLPGDRDRAALTREFLEETPLTSPEIQILSPLAQQLRELLHSSNANEVNQALSELPSSFVAPLDRLSPFAVASSLRATTFLMHDRSDRYLPVSGARRLASHLPTDAHSTYSEFQLFEHVVPGGIEDPTRFAGEMVKLFRHINEVLVVAQQGRWGD